jgi:hypothetical protein
MIDLDNLSGEQALRILRFAGRHDLTVVAALEAVEEARAMIAPAAPGAERSSHQVMRIMTEAPTRAPGMSAALDSGYRRYAAICAAEGVEPVLPEVYHAVMMEFCREVELHPEAVAK